MRLSRRLIGIILLSFALCIFAAPAEAKPEQAQGKPHKGQKEHKVDKGASAAKGPKIKHRGMDANNDGIISRSEWRGNDVSFNNHDWNCDGVLSNDELRPGAPKRKSKCGKKDKFADFGDQDFAGLDRNHDGRISRSEWTGDAAFFDRLDLNHDGFLTPEEYAYHIGGVVTRFIEGVKRRVESFWRWLW